MDGNLSQQLQGDVVCATKLLHSLLLVARKIILSSPSLKWSFVHLLGAIEISIATMSKEERSKASEVYVVGFVPSYLLPNKSPISLDPFLEPLIQEIEKGFINGKNDKNRETGTHVEAKQELIDR